MKYHIGKNGKPAKCTATYRACPLGGADEHFNSSDEAQSFIEEKNKLEFGVLAKASNKMTRECLIEKIEQGETQFEKVDLSGIDLSNLNLDGLNFYEANLEGSNLSGASCFETGFAYTNLRNVNFTNAKLDGARIGLAHR